MSKVEQCQCERASELCDLLNTFPLMVDHQVELRDEIRDFRREVRLLREARAESGTTPAPCARPYDVEPKTGDLLGVASPRARDMLVLDVRPLPEGRWLILGKWRDLTSGLQLADGYGVWVRSSSSMIGWIWDNLSDAVVEFERRSEAVAAEPSPEPPKEVLGKDVLGKDAREAGPMGIDHFLRPSSGSHVECLRQKLANQREELGRYSAALKRHKRTIREQSRKISNLERQIVDSEAAVLWDAARDQCGCD